MLKTRNKLKITNFQIAATYIGTVVGAGFASGQEVLQFFGYFGLGGFAGLTLTTLIFIVYGYFILRLGMEYHARSHLRIIRYAGGKWLGFIIDIIITFFLFGALTAMIAGSGAILTEQFSIPTLWGNILMVIAALLTTLLGISGVINAISFVVPLLLTGVFTLAIMTIYVNIPLNLANLQQKFPGSMAVPNWGLSAVVYASYNLILAVAVLAPLGAKVSDRNKIKIGSFMGGLGLGLGAMAILISLILNLPTAANYEIPMVYVASQFSPWFQLIYSLILLAEIYTTAVGNLYGFAVRITENKSTYKPVVVLTCIVSLIASQFGFSNLVHYLYPLVGYAGFLLIVGLTVGIIRDTI